MTDISSLIERIRAVEADPLREEAADALEALEAEKNDFQDRAESRTMLAWLAVECLWDACWQGSGNEPLSSPGWHSFLSAYEEADEFFRALVVKEAL